MAMIEFHDISKWYGSFQVLTNCTTELQKGEVVVVCGPSGSGKSTLIKCANGLEPFQKGKLLVNGVSVGDPKTNLPKLRSHIGMVFQHFELFPHLSVMENLTIGQVKVLGRSQDEANQKAKALLERVGLTIQAEKFPGQLSGGQQQRVAIARALVMQPQVLLADEPTGNLDTATSNEVMELIQSLNRGHNITVILVTHEPDIAHFGQRLIRLKDGRVIFDGAVAQGLS